MFNELDVLIEHVLQGDTFAAEGNVIISFDAPKREWSARLGRPAINCFLLDVRENPHLRNQQWQPAAGEAEHPRLGRNVAYRKRSPLRVDCTYLVSAWATTAADEHLLLSYAFLALARYPVLPEERLVGSLRQSPCELRTRLAGHEVLPNLNEVWNALGSEVRPCLSYVVTLALDPWTPVADSLVRQLSVSVGQARQPVELAGRRLTDEQIVASSTTIGGCVRSHADPAELLAGVEVGIEGTGLYTRSDNSGRFRFGGLQPGAYTLTARTAAGDAIHLPMQIPAASGDAYDLIV